jgi:4-hydroxybenzoyl-CoA thioesterase
MSDGKDRVEGQFFNTADWRVAWGHCDPAGIVFNPRFMEVFDDCTARLLEAAAGMNKRDFLAAYQAAGIPLVETTARFLRPVTYGDSCAITSHAAWLTRSSFGVRHVLRLHGEVAVEGEEVRVWTARDAEGRMRSAPLPEPLRAALLARPAVCHTPD